MLLLFISFSFLIIEVNNNDINKNIVKIIILYF